MVSEDLSGVIPRMALRSTISQICRTVHDLYLSVAENRRSEAVSLAQLASLFRQLERLPVRTELEENDAERIWVILYLAERRKLNLWKMFPAQLIGLTERRERWRCGLKVAPEYISTAIHEENNVLRVECLAPLVGQTQVAELVRATHSQLMENRERDLILDFSQVRALKSQGIAYLLILTEICQVAHSCATIAKDELRKEILRLLPEPLPILESVEECYRLLSLRDECRQLAEADNNVEGE